MDTAQFKQILEEEKIALETELSAIGRKTPGVPGDWEATPEKLDVHESDDTELADKFEEFEERNAIQNQLENRLIDVKDALTKIEQGTYGICEISGEPIEEARLKANPAARTNIAHKEER